MAQPQEAPQPAPPLRWSIVIPAYNAAATLGAQLEALAAQLPAAGCEVIIADNGSTDSTVSVAESYRGRLPGLEVVDASARRGPCHARNQGAADAGGDTLIFLDADDVVAPGWFTALTAAADDADLVGGNIDSTRLDLTTAAEKAPDWDQLPTSMRFLPWAITANLAVRRDVFDAVGGFDPSLPRAEDIAFSWTAQLAGYRLAFAPEAVVWYRTRSGFRSLWRQGFDNGVAVPLIYRRFRDKGARRNRPRNVARKLVWLVAVAPVAVVVPSRRGEWASRAGYLVGELVGSWRYRVLHL